MDIATGRPEDHPSVLPLVQDSGLAGVTPTFPGFSGPSAGLEGGVRDLTGERLEGLGAIEAACHAAQSTGMAAEHDRRQRYGQDVLPLGAAYGDPMSLPEVPAYMLPPASSSGYPWPGDEPVPPGA